MVTSVIANRVDSRNAPKVCYEEINGQQDRFGHCGFETNRKYRHCTWRYAGEGALALLKCMFHGIGQSREVSGLQFMVRFLKQ